MTDIKVGDRVHATSKTNDDEATFTVTHMCETDIESVHTVYPRDDFDFEVIVPPLPTKIGAVIKHADGRVFTLGNNTAFIGAVWRDTLGRPAFYQPAGEEWTVLFEGVES